MCMIGPSNCVLLIYFLYLTIGARVTPVVLLGQSYLEVTGEFTVSLCVCGFFLLSPAHLPHLLCNHLDCHGLPLPFL